MQTFITLRNAIHPQCYSGANGLIVSYQGQQSTASAYSVWPRETRKNGVWVASRAQSMPCNTKRVKTKRQAERCKKIAIVEILCHAVLARDEGCNTSLMSANSSKERFATLHLCTTLTWSDLNPTCCFVRSASSLPLMPSLAGQTLTRGESGPRD